MYVMMKDEVEDASDVVIGTISIHSYSVTVLLNSGASNSFIVPGIIDKLKSASSLGSPTTSATMLTGDTVRCGKCLEDVLYLWLGMNSRLTCMILT